MPLLTCRAMSMSVGRTCSGRDEVSQMPNGEQRRGREEQQKRAD